MNMNSIHATYRSMAIDQFGMITDRFHLHTYHYYVPLLWYKARRCTAVLVDIADIDSVMFTPDDKINQGILDLVDLNQPIILMGNSFIVLDGNHRVRKHKALGKTKIWAYRVDVGIEDADMVSFKILNTVKVRKGFWKDAVRALFAVSFNCFKGEM